MEKRIEIEEGPADRLVLRAEFPGWSAASLFDHLTRAELLVRWWPQIAEVDLRPGGEYHLSWPQMGWLLRGNYVAVEPERRVSFSWRWDHEPDLPTRTVDIRLDPDRDGVRVTLTHGPYGTDSRELEDRQSHIDGWTHFLGQLRELRS